MAGHGILQSGQPVRLGALLRQQPVALGGSGLEGGDLAGMGGLQGDHQAVQEFAAAARRVGEQPVHLRGQPDGGEAGGDFALGAGGGAIQQEDPPLRILLRGAGADLEFFSGNVEGCSDGPTARGVFALPDQFGEFGAAQAAARHQHGNRFQQICLAAAVRAGEDADQPARSKTERLVGAVIGKG